MARKEVQKAIDSLLKGGLAVVIDDEGRENEADLIMAAEHASAESIAFMVRYTTGIVCVAMEQARLEALALPPMVAQNGDPQNTAFTISVDASCCKTGVSATERAKTIRALADPATKAEQLRRPGHIFPLCSKPKGLFERRGHTEAAVDLCRLAGLQPAGALAELVCDDGSMMHADHLKAFCKQYCLPLITVQQIIDYRKEQESSVKLLSQATLPTNYGVFTAHVYASTADEEIFALTMGDVATDPPPLVRLHSECLTGDVFHSLRCDCSSQLHAALEMIACEGRGVVIYLRGHEGRGIGLAHKIKAYKLQEAGSDTVDANIALGRAADERDYSTAAHILADLKIEQVRLITNNPAKCEGLRRCGIKVVERLPARSIHTLENRSYLKAKKERMGHLLEGV